MRKFFGKKEPEPDKSKEEQKQKVTSNQSVALPKPSITSFEDLINSKSEDLESTNLGNSARSGVSLMKQKRGLVEDEFAIIVKPKVKNTEAFLQDMMKKNDLGSLGFDVLDDDDEDEDDMFAASRDNLMRSRRFEEPDVNLMMQSKPDQMQQRRNNVILKQENKAEETKIAPELPQTTPTVQQKQQPVSMNPVKPPQVKPVIPPAKVPTPQKSQQEIDKQKQEEAARQAEIEKQKNEADKLNLEKQTEKKRLADEAEKQRQESEKKLFEKQEEEKKRLAQETENKRLSELEKQRQETLRLAELDKQKLAQEAENKRLAELEKQKMAQEAEKKRLAELEKQKMAQEAENKRLAELEKQKQAQEAENKRLAELEKQKLAQEAENKRLADLEKQKQAQEAENKRLAELEKQKLDQEAENKRLADLEKQKIAQETENKRIAEQEKLKLAQEAENQRIAEIEKQKLAQQAENKRLSELEKQKQETFRLAELEKQKQAQEAEIRRLADLEKQKLEIQKLEIEKLRIADQAEKLELQRQEAVRLAEIEKQKQAEEKLKLAQDAEKQRVAEAESKRLLQKQKEEAIKRQEQEIKQKQEEEAQRLTYEAEKQRLAWESEQQRNELEQQRLFQETQQRLAEEALQREVLEKKRYQEQKRQEKEEERLAELKIVQEQEDKLRILKEEETKRIEQEENQRKIKEIEKEKQRVIEKQRIENKRIALEAENKKLLAQKQKEEQIKLRKIEAEKKAALELEAETRARLEEQTKKEMAILLGNSTDSNKSESRGRPIPRPSMRQSVRFDEPKEIEEMLSEEDEPEFFKTLADPQVRTTFHKINVIKDEILGLHLRESHFDEDIDDDDNELNKPFDFRKGVVLELLETKPISRQTLTTNDYKSVSIEVEQSSEFSQIIDKSNINQIKNSQLNRQGQQLSIQNQDNFLSNGFVDFTLDRNNLTQRVGTERRLAITKSKPWVEEIESSQSNLTELDDSFENKIVEPDADGNYIAILFTIPVQQSQETAPTSQQEFTDFNQELEEIERRADEADDFVKLLAYNENLYKDQAQIEFNKRKAIMTEMANQQIQVSQQTVISEPKLLEICKNQTPTCIAIQQDLILIGTSDGSLFIYNQQSQTECGVFKEDGKEFIDNPITCIDIHLRRQEYCLVGFQKGQICLVDLSTQPKIKSVKQIKDIYKKAVVSVKFCDWQEEKPHLNQGADHKCKDCQNIKKWMFISVDLDGKVVQTTVSSLGFGMSYTNNTIFIDPIKQPSSYQTIAPRMSSSKYPIEFEDDNVTLVAVGNKEEVTIWMTPEKQMIKLRSYQKPLQYCSQNMHCVAPILQQLPILAWGFGKTPRYNFQTFPILAIAWGPVIQLVVYKQYDADPKQNEDFDLDGFYLIAPDASKTQEMDITIQSLHWIDESLLVAVTSSLEIRVMLTTKFHHENYIEPELMQEDLKFEQQDVRSKMSFNGKSLDPKQLDIEMERVTKLKQNIKQSAHGLPSSQTIFVFNDKIVFLTDKGVYRMHHYHWIESFGDLQQSIKQGSLFSTFAKARQIYLGQIQGFRCLEIDTIKNQLKDLIESQIELLLTFLKSLANKEDREEKIKTLIKIIIEFCVEIQQPVFLLDKMLKLFQKENRTQLFYAEIKPYILSGRFAEYKLSQQVLEDILSYLQQIYADQFEQNSSPTKIVSPAVSPGENFEKILVNFRYDSCTKEFKLSLIDFCKKYKLHSGIVFLSLNLFGEDGTYIALQELKDFYQEALNKETSEQIYYKKEDMQQLMNMPLNSWDRIQIERSACYIGIKLLWIVRMFLIGKKFPSGTFTTNEWHVLCHDVMDLITQDEMIQKLTKIDAAGYFQIVLIVFNNPSYQYSQIEQGRPQPSMKESMSHSLIINRIKKYFTRDIKKQFYLHYLCFIASVAESNFDEEAIYLETLLQLLRHSDLLMIFNRGMLSRRMTDKQMFRRLEKQGINVADELKHIVFTEQMLLQLIERSKSQLVDKALEEALIAVKNSEFQNVKLVLNEIDHQTQRKKLLMQRSKEGEVEVTTQNNNNV